jgi:tetratricopeptide (TPR) repeat protein
MRFVVASSEWVLVERSRLWATCLLSLCLAVGCNRGGAASGGASKVGAAGNSTGELPTELLELNNQGVGYMEQFDEGGGYDKAITVFEEIVRRWPDWKPGKFNLAVAILNSKTVPDKSQVRQILQEILAKDDKDARAHYTLGFLLQYEGKFEEALPHFERVCTDLAPTDAMSWMRLGDCLDAVGDGRRPNAGSALTQDSCYAKALELNPNLPSAYYKMSMNLVRAGKPDEAAKLREKFTALSQMMNDPYAIDYIWSGPLAEAIGLKLPSPRPDERPLPVYSAMSAEFVLANDVRWATADDLAASSHGGLLARIRQRFGAGIAVFDFDKDGDLDLFLPASAIAGGRLRDTLLRNDGEGRFVDVTVEFGLGDPRESIGCAVGDFDADGLPDLYVTAIGGNRLFRNSGVSPFEDATDAAGVAEADSVSLTALLLDLDHDGDLDLLVANYGPLAQADQMFRDQGFSGGTHNSLFLNIGKARTERNSSDQPPLEVGFERAKQDEPPWNHVAATVGFVAADFDNDRDLDLLEIHDESSCRLLINRRVGQWAVQEIPQELVPSGRYNGGLTADFNSDLRIDLMLISPTGPPVYLLNHLAQAQTDQLPQFKVSSSDLSGFRSAQVVDIDFDGWWDIVGVGGDTPTVVLGKNTARGLLGQPEWLKGLLASKSSPQAVVAADFLGDSWPQLLVLHADQPPTMWRTAGNGNRWITVRATGHRKVSGYSSKQPRSNSDGIGTRVIVNSGPHTVVWENTTTSSGLCQNGLPFSIGLSQRPQADTIRLRWSDGLEQAELNLPAKHVVTLDETPRRGDSCPLLFAWNGESFEFITDFLGGGGIGYMVAPGEYSEPDPDEDVWIGPRQIVPDERGNFVLKIAEPMDEMTYLDAAWLEVIDHPDGVTVYPDERFDPAGSHPSGGRVAIRDRIVPVAARDHRSRDVLAKLKAWDRQTVDEFARSRMWIGYTEDHYLELDFGQAFSGVRDDEPIGLFLAGWIEYPYSQTNWAAATAGVVLRPPVLKWLNEHGEWETLLENMGYPAGLPRMMTLDLTGKLPAAVRREQGRDPAPCRLRIETNMEIYWDQIFAARLQPVSQLRRTSLKPARAELAYRGYLQEYSPDGREPKLFDYHQNFSVPLVGLDGIRTPYGSVTELVSDQDNRFALINAGDEVTLTFDSHRLPALPSGWSRSYILRTFGYCKDTDLFNRFDRTVEPLPGQSP